jgi:membrane protease YdiL (CAAX protease family)
MTSVTSPADFAATPTPRAQTLAALELFAGAAAVVGHNIFHVLPNEVPVLVVLALVSRRLALGRFQLNALGFRRPNSWAWILLIAAAATALRLTLGEYVIEPLTALVWPPEHAPAGVESVTGNLRLALLYLPIIWGFAAFGEEIGYRGYLLERAADVGRRSTVAYALALIVSSVLFGIGHFYKGPAGIVNSGVAGLILGGAYLLAGRNLWAPVLAHGFMDSVVLVANYFGWAN